MFPVPPSGGEEVSLSLKCFRVLFVYLGSLFEVLGFPSGTAGKESTYNVGDLGSIPWRRERLPTPVFWPGEFQGLYSPWGRKETDMTERLSFSLHFSLSNFIFGLLKSLF